MADLDEPAKSRVSKILIGRVFNLGDYENIRYEITVDVGADDDPGRVLRSVENILNDLHASSGVMGHNLRHAQQVLARPESELSESERGMLPAYRERVQKHEAALARRQAARDALATLNYTSEHRDAKSEWETES